MYYAVDVPKSDVIRGWGGRALIFSYIHRLRSLFWVQNFEFQYFLMFSEKNEYFGGFEDFVDIFWDHHKIGH